MVPVMEFDTPPTPASLLAIATKRGRGLAPGEAIPHIEATALRLVRPVEDYAHLCGFASTQTLPLTFPDLLARGLHMAVLTHPAFPLRLMGILHTGQRIQQVRPIGSGEPLRGRAWVSGPRAARRGGEFDLNTEIFSADELVWSATTTILSRALPGDGERRPRPQPASWTPSRSTVWSLPGDLGRRYAAVSGDQNPVHLWPLTARLFGFKRPIVHGWWTLARIVAELDGDVPGACTLHASFFAPLPLPGRATFTSGRSADGRVHFEVRRRELCLSGTLVPA
jgi:acyl dehydratase